MNVGIPGQNLKVFAKSIQTLMKIGDDIYFDLYTDHLSIRTINMAKTAFIRFDFSDCFFTCFNLNDSNINSTSKRSSLKSNHCYSKLKLPSKSFQSIFKSTTNPIDRNVENCRIYFAPNEKNRLMFCFKYSTGVTKTHWIRVLELDDNTIKQNANEIQINIIKTKNCSTILSEVLANLQAHEDELNIDVTDPNGKNIVFRNFNENDEPNIKTVRSQVTLAGASEFESYIIRKKNMLSIPLKPFKLAIQFADIFHLPVTFRFNGPQKPLVVLINTPIYNVEFLIATVITDDDESDNSEEITQHSENINHVQKENTPNDLNNMNNLIDESLNINNFTNILEKVQDNNNVNVVNNCLEQQQPEESSDMEIDENINNDELKQQSVDMIVDTVPELEQQGNDLLADTIPELEQQLVDIEVNTVSELEQNLNIIEQNDDTISSEIDLEKFIFSRCFDTSNNNESHSSNNEEIFVEGTQ